MYKIFASLMLSSLLCLAGYANAEDTMTDNEATESSTADETAPVADTVADTAPIAATQFTCGLGDGVRHVKIAYHQPGQPVPCSVLYDKETENPGNIETLWTAENEAGYCEDKAATFVDKLETFGWVCQPSGS